MNTPFFDSLIDDFGIWQHTDGQKPLFEHGYALDDATRGLLVCLALDKQKQAHVLFDYLLRSRKGNDFYGFADGHRTFFDFPSSDDAKGQVVWAMGYAASRGFEAATAQHVVAELAPSLLTMQAIRGHAYALLGAVYTDKTLAHGLQRLVATRFDGLRDDWFWPEETMTYANGLLPYALLRYALVYNDQSSEALGRKALAFIEQACTKDGRLRGPIGYDGWYHRGGKPADDGQQAIDAAYMIWAWIAAYQLSHDEADLEKAQAWMQWFEGDNLAHTRMYDPATLQTYDGINLHARDDHHDARGINYHSGAESNICLILTKYMLAEHITL